MRSSGQWNELVICIPTFQRLDSLQKVIESIDGQSMVPSYVLIIDNGGTAKSLVEELPQDKFHIVYMDVGYNAGPAGAFAKGLEYIWKNLGPDVWMMCRGDDNPFFSAREVELLHEFWSIVRPRCPAGIGVHGERLNKLNMRLSRVPLDELGKCDFVSVDCIPGVGSPIYSADALRKSQINFDKTLFFGREELDIGLMIRRSKLELLIDCKLDRNLRRRLGIENINDASSIYNKRRQLWRIYFHIRNTLVIARKHRNAKWILQSLLESIRPMIGSLAVRRSWSEFIARGLAVVDGLVGSDHSRRYIPRTAAHVAIDHESPFFSGRRL